MEVYIALFSNRLIIGLEQLNRKLLICLTEQRKNENWINNRQTNKDINYGYYEY
jgi:hypothetical protein